MNKLWKVVNPSDYPTDGKEYYTDGYILMEGKVPEGMEFDENKTIDFLSIRELLNRPTFPARCHYIIKKYVVVVGIILGVEKYVVYNRKPLDDIWKTYPIGDCSIDIDGNLFKMNDKGMIGTIVPSILIFQNKFRSSFTNSEFELLKKEWLAEDNVQWTHL